jgi:hypothetical protein
MSGQIYIVAFKLITSGNGLIFPVSERDFRGQLTPAGSEKGLKASSVFSLVADFISESFSQTRQIE